MVSTKIRLIIILCSQRWRSSIQSAETRLGADCGSDHELLIAKFRLIIILCSQRWRNSIQSTKTRPGAQSGPTLCNPMDCSSPGSSVHGVSPGKNTGVGCHDLLQGIFPTQGSNPGLPNFRQFLYQLSHKGSPRILEWVAYPFSREYSQPRN